MALTKNRWDVTLDRSLPELPVYHAWQGCPVDVVCSLPAGSTDTLADALSLFLEIKSSQTTDEEALCSKEIANPESDSNGPWTFELDASDLGIAIADDLPQRKLFLKIVATFANDNPDVLAAGTVVLNKNNFDGASINPPGVVVYASRAFKNIAVSGQTTVEADSAEDTLTLAGSGLAITTSGNTITFTVGAASVAWGGITGSIANQLDLKADLDAKASLSGATFTGTVGGSVFQAANSSGVSFHTSGGSDVLNIGQGNSVVATAYGSWNFDAATADTIASFGASKTLTSLSTATYPSLPELSYVKGVTSGIQTQLNAKAASGLVRIISDTGATTVYNPASDTDAARGTALFNACAAATAGQTVYVSAGAYQLSGASVKLTLANNVNLFMEDGVVITSNADLLTEGCVIYPGNNSIIRGGKIVCSGSSSQYAAAIGVVGDVFEEVRTGVQVIGVTMVGDSDCFYIQEDTGNCEAVLRDCLLISKWDNIVATSLSTGAAHRIDVYNCRQIITGPSATGSNQARGVLANFDSVIRVFGGSIECTNGGTDINAAIYAKDGGTIEAHGVTMVCSNGVNPNYDLQIGTGGGTIKVSGGTGSGTAGGYLTTGTITYLDGKIAGLSGLLKANGSGVLSAAAAGTDYLAPNGNGSALTALNATQLTSGTVPDARLSSNVALVTGSTYTGALLIAAGTASAPSLAFSADADGSGTGVYRSAANEISFSTNGTQRARIAATGEVYIPSTTASSSTSTGALVVSGGLGVGETVRTTGAIFGGALIVASSGFAALSGGVVKLMGTSGGGDASRLAFQFTPSSSGAAIGISGTTLTAQRGDGSAGGTFATSGGRTKAIAIKTTTYTVTTNDEYIIGNHATVAFTVTLIAASTNTGRAFIFMNKGAANMTIDATSLGQITDSTASNTKVLTTGQSLRLISDGATWISY